MIRLEKFIEESNLIEGDTGNGFLREWVTQTVARGRVGFYDLRDIYYRSLR